MILNPKVVSIGEHSWIDRYVLLEGGNGIDIGRYVHIAPFVHIQGGGTVTIGDYAGIASGVRIFSDSDQYTKRMCACLPHEQQDIKGAPVILGKDTCLGLNTVLLSAKHGIKIGDGTVVGANSLVTGDLPSWKIAWGSPARVVKDRARLNLPDV
jgi:galactoside O-acetyltransferase